MNPLVSKAIGAYVRFVQASASSKGGQCTWAFSQCTNPVATLIAGLPVTEDGICEMLSAKWVDEHAHEGHLATWLANGGKTIDPSKIRLLMQLFAIGTDMSASRMVEDARQPAGPGGKVQYRPIHRGGTDQTKATRNFLLSRGLIRRGDGWTKGWGAGDDGAGAKIKLELARQLVDSKGGTGSYRMIGVWGKGGAHAMAAYVGLHDIAFFDPNFGEFWFESKQQFVPWFTETFFPRAHYTSQLGQRFELHDYALRGRMIASSHI